VLNIVDVHTYYETDHILQGVSLEVPDGRIVAVLGRNGVGKTTLVRSILGITTVTRSPVYRHIASHNSGSAWSRRDVVFFPRSPSEKIFSWVYGVRTARAIGASNGC
jgi:ABC-type branched-subunit amino acid transport system ATPase component